MARGGRITHGIRRVWPDITGLLRAHAPITGQVLPLGIVTLLATLAILSTGVKQDNLWLDPMNIILRALQVNFLDLQTYASRPMYGHPPLFFLILRAWIGLTGTTLFSLHMLPVLTSVLAAAFVYRIASDFVPDTFASVAASLIFASMGMVRYYAVEVHNYSLLLMFSTAVLFFFERWWSHAHSRIYSAGIVLTTAGLLYTHYYGIFVVLALNACALILSFRNVRTGLRWFTLQAVAGLLFLPQLPDIFRGANRGLGSGTAAADQESLRLTTWQGIGLVVNRLLDFQVAIFLAIVVIGGLLLIVRRRASGGRKFLRSLIIAGFFTLISFGLVLAVNVFIPSLVDRRVIYLLAGTSIIAGCALSFWPRGLRWLALAGVVLTIQSVPLEGISPGVDHPQWHYQDAMNLIARDYQPGDLLYIQNSNSAMAIAFDFYANRALPPNLPVLALVNAHQMRIATRTTALGHYTLDNEHNQDFFANDVFASYVWNRDRFWVINAVSGVYGDPDIDWIGKIDGRDFTRAKTVHMGWIDVSLFTAPPAEKPVLSSAASPPDRPEVPVTVGDVFELEDFQIDRLSATPGQEIALWLDWRAVAMPTQDYAIFVHLIRDDETVVDQIDGEPTHSGRDLPTIYWALGQPVYDHKVLPISTDTPPGSYQIKVGMYDRATLAKLPVHLHSGKIADGLVLVDIEVR